MKTPLYDRHVALGAKMIDFGGWDMPVQYTSLMDEHKATRSGVTLFDICHMGEILVSGPGAFDLLQLSLTRNLSSQTIGQVRLSALLNDQGGMIDDLTVYKMGPERYILVTNATTRQSDFSRLSALRQANALDCQLLDISDQTGKLDLQGPEAQALLQSLTGANLSTLRYYYFISAQVAGRKTTISRSGYTGEDGFELYAAADQIGELWDGLMEAGRPFGLQPAGLGARDTLRLEAGMLLNGQDMNESITPLEVPYGWLVDFTKDFAGKAALMSLREAGFGRKLVGFEMTSRGIARHGYKAFSGNDEIGLVTSGTFSPTLSKSIGLALLDARYTEPGTAFSVAIRNTKSDARVVLLPFYKR